MLGRILMEVRDTLRGRGTITVMRSALAALLLVACEGGASGARPAPQYRTVEETLSNGAHLLRVRLTDPGAAAQRSEPVYDGPVTLRYVPWRMEVTQRVLARNLLSMPPAESGTFLQEVSRTNVTGRTTLMRWAADTPGRPALESGREYLLYCSICPMRALYLPPEVPLYAVAPDGTLAEPAFGFPAGTPLERVFDTSGVNPWLLHPLSGGPAADADTHP